MKFNLKFVALLGFVIVAPPAYGQERARDPERVYVSRSDLTALLDWYERSASSPVYSESLRERARSEASSIQTRLEEGDFQVGDKVPIVVDGEEALTDTFTVATGGVIRLGELGDVSLEGVLRSELDEHLREYIGRYVRDPSLRAQSLIRVTIEGAVGQPGFYNLPAITPLSDAIMAAGGPVADAKLQDVRIERGTRRLLSGEQVRRAIADGRTLDQLSLRAGDRIILPQSRTLGSAEGALRAFSILIALPLSIFALISIF